MKAKEVFLIRLPLLPLLKKKFGICYRSYVNVYRLKLIEERMEDASLSIKQIPDEFGYTTKVTCHIL